MPRSGGRNSPRKRPCPPNNSHPTSNSPPPPPFTPHQPQPSPQPQTPLTPQEQEQEQEEEEQEEQEEREDQAAPSTLTSLRPLQQIRSHPRDFDSKFLSALFQTGEQAGYWRDPLASRSGLILLSTGGGTDSAEAAIGDQGWQTTPQIRDGGRIQRQGISAGSTGELLAGILSGILELSSGGLLWWDTGSGTPLWRDTWRDPLASRSTGEQLWHSGGILGGIHWRAALAGSTGEPLWRDTQRDPLASRSGGILSGIHSRAALAGHWDPLMSSSGGIPGGIHWRAALAGYSAGSSGELLWRDTGWGRGVEASQTRIPT